MGITLIRNRLKFISKYLQLFLFYMLFLFLSLFLFLRCFWKKNNKYETKMGIRTQKIYFILVSEDSETNLNASHCWHALFLFLFSRLRFIVSLNANKWHLSKVFHLRFILPIDCLCTK